MKTVPKALKILCLTLGFNFFATSYSVRTESKIETANSVGNSIEKTFDKESEFFKQYFDKNKDRFRGDLDEFDGLKTQIKQRAEDIISKYSFKLKKEDINSDEFSELVDLVESASLRFAGKENYSDLKNIVRERFEDLQSSLPKEDVKELEKDIEKLGDYLGEFSARIGPDNYEAGCEMINIRLAKDSNLEKTLGQGYKNIVKKEEISKDDVEVCSSAVIEHVKNLPYEIVVDYERFNKVVDLANEYGYDPVFKIGNADVPISEICDVLKANDVKQITFNNQIMEDFIADDDNIERKVMAFNRSLGKKVISISTMEDVTNGILRYLSPPQTGIRDLKAWESEAYLSNQSIDTGHARYATQHMWYELAFPKLIGLSPRVYVGKTDFNCKTSLLAGLEANANVEALNLGLSTYKKINFLTAKLNLGISSVGRGNAEVLFGISNKYKIMEEDLRGRIFPHGNLELAADLGWFTVMTNILPAITIDKKILPAIQPDYTVRFKPISVSWKPSLDSYECSTTIKF